MRFTAAIVCVNNEGSREQEDILNTRVIEDVLRDYNYNLVDKIVVPGELETIKETLKYLSDVLNIDVILTTGGTGLSPRDNTPEATKAVIHKEAPGISEMIRQYSMTLTSMAMLTRGVSGLRNDSLIINLPGNPSHLDLALNEIIDTVHTGMLMVQRYK